MLVNFYPNRERMLEEVEACIRNDSLDVLKSFCACCSFALITESLFVTECMQCAVHKGIANIANKKNWTPVPDLDFLGVC